MEYTKIRLHTGIAAAVASGNRHRRRKKSVILHRQKLLLSRHENQNIQLADAQKLFRIYPYLFVEFDIVYDVFEVLQSCSSWGLVANKKEYLPKPRITFPTDVL